jgi:hypothetical protein
MMLLSFRERVERVGRVESGDSTEREVKLLESRVREVRWGVGRGEAVWVRLLEDAERVVRAGKCVHRVHIWWV